uniref:Reverse transcriptase domain-containing protein n=1 Tax=Hucho hucho TaxID=62062 RepID=A0A4W5L6E0_9TELE
MYSALGLGWLGRLMSHIRPIIDKAHATLPKTACTGPEDCTRTTAFNQGKATGNMFEYKQCSYSLRKAIKQAKRQYRDKVESQFNGSDTRGMWQGLQSITDYKKKTSPVADHDVLLPDKLNNFFARFEDNTVPPTRPATKTCGLTFTAANVRKTFKCVNPRKAAGPDGIPGRVLRACADQLAGVFTDIFNQSLSQSAVPTCFKRATIVPVPKKAKVTELNDYRPVALTSVIMKCFERLVKDHITSILPDTLDPLQFAYRPNRSTDDAIAITLHTALTHLDKRNTYVRMLFIDYSSAFNTIVPSKLVIKLETLGLDPALCNWVLDFLTGRSQVVRVGNNISTPLILNTGAPQGCVLSPLLYSLFTHDCVAKHASNSIIKFADDTTVVGLITNNDETAYREEVRALGVWCQENNLSLNVSKTKEMIVDFRKQEREHPPIHIEGTVVE